MHLFLVRGRYSRADSIRAFFLYIPISAASPIFHGPETLESRDKKIDGETVRECTGVSAKAGGVNFAWDEQSRSATDGYCNKDTMGPHTAYTTQLDPIAKHTWQP